MKQGIFMREIKAGDNDAVIDVVGVIGWEVWYPAMRDMLRSIPDTVDRVVFDIYSPGGDVWEGNAIIQEIGALKQKTVARVQVAASMATLIAVACEEREIASNGRWLIHNPWTVAQGDAEAMDKAAQSLRDCEKEAAKFYADRTGKSQKEMRELMNEERWLMPSEALEYGFVHKINDPFDVKAFAGVKAEIVAAGKWPQGLAEMPIEPVAVESETIEDNPEPEEKPDASDNAERPAGDEVAPPADAVKPADEPEAEVKPEDMPWYSVGFTAGVNESTGKVEALTAEVNKLKGEVAKRDDLLRKMQSDRDRLAGEVKALKESLDESNKQLTKLLAGGLTFSAPIETWEEAMQACNGDYVEARRKYPDAYRVQREKEREVRAAKGK